MKKLIFILVLAAIVCDLNSQVPTAFNYQAVARNSSGEMLAQTELTIRIGILKNEVLIWQEDHSVLTDQFGHFTISIGGSEAENGNGTAESFENIDWGTGSFMINLSADDGDGFADMGSTPLLSVPFALFSAGGGSDPDPANELVTELFLTGNTLFLRENENQKTVDLSSLGDGSNSAWSVSDLNLFLLDPKLNIGIGTDRPAGKFVIQGNAEIPDDVPLFEVRNYKDEVMLSSFNNGTFINIETEIKKGLKGGFAVGGYNANKAPEIQEYFRVTSDSIRVTVNDELSGKGLKGGFAVGGYNSGKADKLPYFFVERGVTLIDGRLEVSGAISEMSDERLKGNIIEIDNVLESIKQFRGVYFDWNQLASETITVAEDTRQIGVLAQEIESVYPELVITNGKGYKMVDYSKLTAVLLEAIKEQQEEIYLLKEESLRIAVLEERISQLEAVLNQ